MARIEPIRDFQFVLTSLARQHCTVHYQFDSALGEQVSNQKRVAGAEGSFGHAMSLDHRVAVGLLLLPGVLLWLLGTKVFGPAIISTTARNS
jgi:hypothetical protein